MDQDALPDTRDAAPITGRFEGDGAWYDGAGKSQRYRVVQTGHAVAGGFEIAFTHHFDDGSVVEARFEMTWIAPFIFRVSTGGAELGHGHWFDDDCQYGIAVAERVVQVSYRLGGDECVTVGSSSRNAEGLYVAWHEHLRRVPAAG